MQKQTAEILQKAFNDGVVVDTYATQLQTVMEERYGVIDDGNDALLYRLLEDLMLHSRIIKRNISNALKAESKEEKSI